MDKMYSDDNLLQLSGLQHLLYCPRQCALAYIEQQWTDNFFTAKGILMHEKAHNNKIERKKNVIIEHDIYVKSYALGLVGKSDIVEFHKFNDGNFVPFPVEYKSGKAKKDNTDKVQLCAYALCLEEMMKIKISKGAIFYGKTRNRLDVEFNENLKSETILLAQEFHSLIDSEVTPQPKYSKKCDNCSLNELCLPKICDDKNNVKKYLENVVKNNNEETI
jgi:CRISPR-associated exonuclease Cas4